MEATAELETFRAEHRELIARVAELGRLAESLEGMSLSDRAAAVDNVLYFLRHVLLPHAHGEEQVLYPAVSAIVGYAGATAAMELDHEAIAERAHVLAEADPADVPRMRRQLYGLEALIEEHFRKEEELYLPLLAEQAPEYVADVSERMRRAGHAGSHA